MTATVIEFTSEEELNSDYLKKVTFGIGTNLLEEMEKYLAQEKYNNKDFNFLNESFTLYYNSVICANKGAVIVFPNNFENYNIKSVLPRNTSSEHYQVSTIMCKESHKLLSSLIPCTSAKTIGDIIRSAIYFYIMYLQSEDKGDNHRPYIYNTKESFFLTDIIEILDVSSST